MSNPEGVWGQPTISDHKLEVRFQELASGIGSRIFLTCHQPEVPSLDELSDPDIPSLKTNKKDFRTAWHITDQEFQGFGLKLQAVKITFRDLASHVCQKNESG